MGEYLVYNQEPELSSALKVVISSLTFQQIWRTFEEE